LKDFVKVFGVLEPFGKVLFRTLDTKSEGWIDNTKFIMAVVTLMRGTQTERTKFAFGLLDDRKNGQVSLESFTNTITMLFNCIDATHLLMCDPVVYCKKVFQLIDTNKTGTFSLEDYSKFLETNAHEIVGLGHVLLESFVMKKYSPPGNHIYFGSKLWSPSLEMMIGIRHTVLMFAPTTRVLKASDFSVVTEFSVPTGQDDPATFTSYAPQVFSSIRRKFLISEEDYSISLGPEQILGNLLTGHLGSFSEKTSDGKSGSFFFFSNDSRFMAKTISKAESRCFLQILPMYYKYMMENPDTLLVRVCGWHELHDQVFIILGSVFPAEVKVSECYDLKGSTQGRTNKTGFVKKDLDIKKGRMKIPFGERKKILDQVKKDTEFLKSLNIIDYSFLCGIHDGPSSAQLGALTNCPTIHSTTVVLTETEVYFMGIIDIFTVFDFKKTTEHSMKSLVYKSSSISAVPAPQYQDRFCKFIDTCME
jgi:Ca2+-binding EF-hand superfamily protein